ncbi:DNA-directed RNA polymerase subunit beta' [Candidatus Dependentiae bacterium]|nr:MAG: DNA-directed RNA polymerase subunit beta' [Candidatus Dependentiae bacterium]
MRVSIASPAKIIALSYGEIKKIETINYRTLKPERDGLFCARIFGPMKDWECNCGKYKRMKHRGVTCEKCGVEVIQSRVRRERMGHVNLVSKVCHIWYLKGIPSYLSLILDMTVRDIEKIIYFDSYVVINQGNSPFLQKTLLTSQEFDEYVHENIEDIQFKAEMGAEAVHLLLAAIDLLFYARKAQEEYEQTASVAQKHRFARRYKLLMDMNNANIRPEWMVLSILPVIPPDLRPLVPIEGGRFASSDLNDLYRRVLNRNIRLQRLIELEAPDVMIKNERRMLQESVDALIDNGRRGHPVRGSNKRPLKSLSEMLRGKQGRFRQNLLGKRVDYSGRSVIVVDPELQLDQCGLPKLMALELFKPYVYVELQNRELAMNLRMAKRMVEEQTNEVWEALETVVKGRPVLLNRAPTLHRLSIQAFFPILVEGKAIKIHPLVCTAFNADFDGDQMAVHVPLSMKARAEAINLMLSTKNILTAASGRPITIPSQDMVLGLYYMTKSRNNALGEGLIFANVEEVIYAYQHKKVHLQASIKLCLNDKRIIETTVGRVLVYEQLPKETEFEWINKVLAKSDLVKLISKIYRISGQDKTVIALDNIKKLGFTYATLGGISLCIDDLIIPKSKKAIVDQGKKEVAQAEKLFRNGVITNGERRDKVIQIWSRATEDVTNAMIDALKDQDIRAHENVDGLNIPFNPVYIMLDSGARGTRQQIRQLGGMRGLMSKPSGETMETPVLANFKDGLNVFEYFISTHGARKGLADTALRTADSGYLTRRLVDIAQDVVITKLDCGTLGYINVSALQESGLIIETLLERVHGRIVADTIIDPVSGKEIAAVGDIIGESVMALLKESAVTEVSIRSVLTCQAVRGVCVKCYGLDLSTSELVDIGSAVGIIAAQSIGEPGTQLTMRTFHVGGIASGVLENTYFKTKFNGKVQYRGVQYIKNSEDQLIVMNRKAKIAIIADDGREREVCNLEYGGRLLVKDDQQVKIGDKLIQWDPYKVIMTDKTGKVTYVDLIENVTFQEYFDESSTNSTKTILERRDEKRQPYILVIDDKGEEARYYLPTGAHLIVENGSMVHAGDVLAKLMRKEGKSKDITGGLPRASELFEARVPSDVAVLSEVDGKITFGGLHRGQRRIMVTTEEGETFEYTVARSKYLNVEDGEQVSAGDPLTSGNPNVHDILRILGPDELQKYLVKEIQSIYTLQGVSINDKHIEVIVRQMLKKVRITDPGDTTFIVGDRIDKVHLQLVNKVMAAESKKIALSCSLLMGLTKASMGTDSFISAASFQETTKVLTEAALAGQVDYLRCLKSNITIGRLIPAGTGIASFRIKHLGDDISEYERQARVEEQLEVGLDKISLS